MKKILITLILALLLASCGVSNNKKNINKKPVEPVNNNQVENIQNNENSQNDNTQNIDLSKDDEKMINDILGEVLDN